MHCWRRANGHDALEAAPAADTVEELIARQVEDVEVELRRIDQRLRSVGWDRPPPRRLPMSEQWGAFAGTVEEPVDHGYEDGVVHSVLMNKQQQLLQQLRELRAQLTGTTDRPRGGRW